MYMCVSVGALGDQRYWLGFQVAVSCIMWLLGTKLGSLEEQ